MAMTAKEKAALATAKKSLGGTSIPDAELIKAIKSAAKTQGISLFAAGKLVAHRAKMSPKSAKYLTDKQRSAALKDRKDDPAAARRAAQRSRKSKGMKLSDLTAPSKDTLKKATDKVAAKRAKEMESRGGEPQTLKRALTPGWGSRTRANLDAIKAREAAAKETVKKIAASKKQGVKEVENILAKKAGKPSPHPKAKAPAKAVAAKAKRKLTPKELDEVEKAEADSRRTVGDVGPMGGGLEDDAMLEYGTRAGRDKRYKEQLGRRLAGGEAVTRITAPGSQLQQHGGDLDKIEAAKYGPRKAKAKAPAKTSSLKGAPRPELPKKSDPEYKAKLSKFRKWYTANRAKPKKKKVVLTKAAPVKTAPTKAAPKKAADPTGLKARIAQKRETGQRIPKSWLKAEREKDLKVTKENLAEVQRGRKEMAERKSRIAAANMKVTKENLAEVQRGRKEMSERKARVSADKARRKAQRLAQLDPLVKARQKAEVARGKTEAQERVARMRKDAAERAKRKKMQAKMSALPGFRSK